MKTNYMKNKICIDMGFFKLHLLIVIGLSWLFLVGCSDVISKLKGTEPGNSQGEVAFSSFDVNKYPLNKLVCDPLGETSPIDNFEGGLKAELFYLQAHQPKYKQAAQYAEFGTPSDQHLFFAEVNVPTRRFELGFPTQTGDLVKTNSGEVLVEYFGIRFESQIRLAPDQEEGEYQLALLSDDGTVWTVYNQEGEMHMVVDNDGDHPTRLECGETLFMGKESLWPIRFDYYQGPRFHISFIPLWRRVEGSVPHEPLCGQMGNSLYFDYNNNSEPKAAYLALLNRGWQPLKAENYVLPHPDTDHNPCKEGDVPEISDFAVFDALDGTVIVSWNTDIPSTSQVRYYNHQTQTEILTTSDNILRTTHEIFIHGLSSGGVYDFQAIAISETFGKKMGPVLTLTIK